MSSCRMKEEICNITFLRDFRLKINLKTFNGAGEGGKATVLERAVHKKALNKASKCIQSCPLSQFSWLWSQSSKTSYQARATSDCHISWNDKQPWHWWSIFKWTVKAFIERFNLRSATLNVGITISQVEVPFWIKLEKEMLDWGPSLTQVGAKAKLLSPPCL